MKQPSKDPRVLLPWARRKAAAAKELLDQTRNEGYRNDRQWARKHKLIDIYRHDWLNWVSLVQRYEQLI